MNEIQRLNPGLVTSVTPIPRRKEYRSAKGVRARVIRTPAARRDRLRAAAGVSMVLGSLAAFISACAWFFTALNGASLMGVLVLLLTLLIVLALRGRK